MKVLYEVVGLIIAIIGLFIAIMLFLKGNWLNFDWVTTSKYADVSINNFSLSCDILCSSYNTGHGTYKHCDGYCNTTAWILNQDKSELVANVHFYVNNREKETKTIILKPREPYGCDLNFSYVAYDNSGYGVPNPNYNLKICFDIESSSMKLFSCCKTIKSKTKFSKTFSC